MRTVVALLVCLTLASCTTGADGSDQETLTVLAAASLTESFTELEQEFEADLGSVDVRLAFDSSATLAQQVIEGAPADVLATADERTMRTAVDADVVDGSPEIFATNELVLVVPAENPAGIEQFTDLDDPDVDYVACAESAPCGAAARTLLEASRIGSEPKSLEVDVKAVLSKVALDEADAGLVYATDAVAAGDRVKAISVPQSDTAVNRYPIAVPTGSGHPELAEEWIEFVLSDRGQALLGDNGFGSPG